MQHLGLLGQPIRTLKTCLKTTAREVNCPKVIAWVIANLQAHRQRFRRLVCLTLTDVTVLAGV